MCENLWPHTVSAHNIHLCNGFTSVTLSHAKQTTPKFLLFFQSIYNPFFPLLEGVWYGWTYLSKGGPKWLNRSHLHKKTLADMGWQSFLWITFVNDSHICKLASCETYSIVRHFYYSFNVNLSTSTVYYFFHKFYQNSLCVNET